MNKKLFKDKKKFQMLMKKPSINNINVLNNYLANNVGVKFIKNINLKQKTIVLTVIETFAEEREKNIVKYIVKIFNRPKKNALNARI